jgi:hypothetical protein
MARLRVRVELNRGGVGIPLHKLASVVQESQRFFQLLAQDVRIEKDRGEWLAFDLDNGSLNFTAEYVGPVSAEQVSSFYAAFDGVTSLRRATIAQFTRIAEAIGEDELIGFGLYGSDQETEPTEWRCLSRRDALRIADEIRILQGAAGELEPESHLRAVIDSDRGARLFKERHNRSAVAGDQSKWSSFVRAVESNLANRITRLEGEVENHSGMIRDLRQASAVTEESFRNLLSSVEKFCGQATNQLERLTPQSPPHAPLLVGPASFSTPPPLSDPGRRRRTLGIITVVLLAIAVATFLLWPSKPAEPDDQSAAVNGSSAPVEVGNAKEANDNAIPPAESAAPKAAAKAPRPVEPAKAKGPAENVASTEQPAEPGAAAMHIELEAREPAWVSVTDVDGNSLLAGTLQPNETRSLELTKGATLRTGNAGALVIRFNGKDVGPLGPVGKIRDVEFKDGTFKIHAPNPGQSSGAAGLRKEDQHGEVT